MKKLPIGIQTLPKLINSDCQYIDKTEQIHHLISNGNAYFISRPCRFGKSLLVSTLEEVFGGNQELFKDLWIYDKIEWKKYPVIRLDFSLMDYKYSSLELAICRYLSKIADDYNLEIEQCTPKVMFEQLIKKLSDFGQLVILVDEYDKPIIDFIDDIKTANENREILKSFYGCLKGLDANIKFLLLTGVSKFSKVSIFSDLNHLNDITLDEKYSTLFGCTEAEIKLYFAEYIQNVCSKHKLTIDELFDKMRLRYNGYSWDGENFVYNPFSVLNFFDKMQFGNYWFATGTPTLLVDFIKKHKILPDVIVPRTVSLDFFDKFEISNIDIFALMFQTGYLTIKEQNGERFILNYPNAEVETAFEKNLLESYSSKVNSEVGSAVFALEDALNEHDLEKFIDNMTSLFASIPHQIFIKNKEAYYHSIIYLALKLVGAYIQSEISTSKGRIDAVVHTKDYIYVMEFKMQSAETAMQQIKEKKYYEKYLNRGKKIYLWGIGFDSKNRSIGKIIEEELSTKY